jgi:hypothetical protein
VSTTDRLHTKPFVRDTYVVLLLCLVASTAALSFSLRIALLPVALLFGWIQIGGG